MSITYQKARNDDESSLKNLWLSCFDDTPEAVELFFNRNKSYLHGYTAKLDGRIVAALYLIDCTLNGSKAHYLCGAATLPRYRKRGIMSALIEYSLNDASLRGDKFSILFPANESLYDFYSKLGYVEGCSVCKKEYGREELEREKSAYTSTKTPDFESMQLKCLKSNFLLWNNNFVSFACEYYSLYGSKVECSEKALAFFEEENSVCVVFYSVYNDIKELKTLLLDNSNANSFVIYGKCDDDNSKKEKYGMARVLDKTHPLPRDIYIGITLM